ncbi:DUF1542 domain-containing protein [Fructobacillus sp. M158]|uniref:DUF1542 domain-containing protein n=1 Tax=Fructobacillus parabroussonetiae TaxID=2713174 RepID=UPI00200B58DF|nr:DUF1542 domain-containing protein [Fructobacillus parabroussonetiae]MCK8617183.1 DUF1542 domain-containing protein [Fructobacillus parabroussonetiae]
MAAEAKKIIDAITADDTLTASEKAEQIAQVKTDLLSGDQIIDAATNQTAMTNAYSKGKVKIDGDHVPGESIAGQKDKAKTAIDNAAKKASNDINNDSKLTPADKAKQVAQVQKDADAAKAAIDQATNADAVQQAAQQGEAKIAGDYVPGSGVPITPAPAPQPAAPVGPSQTAVASENAQSTVHSQLPITSEMNRAAVSGKPSDSNRVVSREQAQQQPKIKVPAQTRVDKYDATKNHPIYLTAIFAGIAYFFMQVDRKWWKNRH